MQPSGRVPRLQLPVAIPALPDGRPKLLRWRRWLDADPLQRLLLSLLLAAQRQHALQLQRQVPRVGSCALSGGHQRCRSCPASPSCAPHTLLAHQPAAASLRWARLVGNAPAHFTRQPLSSSASGDCNPPHPQAPATSWSSSCRTSAASRRSVALALACTRGSALTRASRWLRHHAAGQGGPGKGLVCGMHAWHAPDDAVGGGLPDAVLQLGSRLGAHLLSLQVGRHRGAPQGWRAAGAGGQRATAGGRRSRRGRWAARR